MLSFFAQRNINISLKGLSIASVVASTLVYTIKVGQLLIKAMKLLAETIQNMYSNHLKTLTWNQVDKVAASCLAMAAFAYLVFANNVTTEPVIITHSQQVETQQAATTTAPTVEEMVDEAPVEMTQAEEHIEHSPSITPAIENTEYTPGVYSQIASIHEKFGNMLAEEARLAPKVRKIKVGRGDTLTGLLVNKANVGATDAYQAVEALKKLYDPRDLNAGDDVTVLFKYDPKISENTFAGIEIEKDIVNSVAVKANAHGTYKATEIVKHVEREFKGFSGEINDSLYLSAKRSGVPDYIIVELIRMFSWSVDFQREIRTGDKFEILYEEYKTEDGKVVTHKGNILYAKLNARGSDMPFYRFKDSTGFVDYYNDEGRSAKKTLMRTPIDGARLTSGFGKRKHPILGYNKMHKGVDFAAPRGTPIYASGDGIVERIGRNGGYGNYIRIKHRNGLKTAYAHLKGFKRGLKKGQRVKQGAVIGYLGSTGRSTGPHLHYEVIVHGKRVNPRSLKLPAGTKLAGKDLKRFKRTRATAMANFKNAYKQTQLAENTATRERSSTIKN